MVSKREQEGVVEELSGSAEAVMENVTCCHGRGRSHGHWTAWPIPDNTRTPNPDMTPLSIVLTYQQIYTPSAISSKH